MCTPSKPFPCAHSSAFRQLTAKGEEEQAKPSLVINDDDEYLPTDEALESGRTTNGVKYAIYASRRATKTCLKLLIKVP